MRSRDLADPKAIHDVGTHPAAGGVRGLQHLDAQAGSGEIERASEAGDARADDDRVQWERERGGGCRCDGCGGCFLNGRLGRRDLLCFFLIHALSIRPGRGSQSGEIALPHPVAHAARTA